MILREGLRSFGTNGNTLSSGKNSLRSSNKTRGGSSGGMKTQKEPSRCVIKNTVDRHLLRIYHNWRKE